MPPVASRNRRLAANSAAMTMSVARTAVYSSRTKGSATNAASTIAAAIAARRSGATTSARCSGSGVVAGIGNLDPSRPCGFTARTIAMTTNSATSVRRGNATVMPKRSTSPSAMQKRLGHADQHRREKRAGNRAQAADHRNDEGLRDDGQIHAEVGRFARQLQRAGQPGQERAEGEDGRDTAAPGRCPAPP